MEFTASEIGLMGDVSTGAELPDAGSGRELAQYQNDTLQPAADREEPRHDPGNMTMAQLAGGVLPSAPQTVGAVEPPYGGGSYAPFVLAAGWAILGGIYGGWWGAAASVLTFGSVMNYRRWRAAPTGRDVDGLVVLATTAAAVYAWVHVAKQRAKRRPSAEKDDVVVDVVHNGKGPVRRDWLRPTRES